MKQIHRKNIMTKRTDNNYQIYMSQIARYPLLTAEREKELATRIRNGDAAAREEMIQGNLRLVIKIALEYNNLGVPLLDLISEGNIGLIRAVERFDKTKGVKLSTFAAYWINQRIKRALVNQSKTIRLPVHLTDKLSMVRRVAQQMGQDLGREPTVEEIADETGISLRKLKSLWRVSNQTTSLDQTVGDHSEHTLGEMVNDESMRDPAQIVSDAEMRGKMMEAMHTLDKRERSVINARFGFGSDEPLTLDEVGEKMGFTRERIRQIQNNALKKLRKEIEKNEAVALPA